MWSRAKRTERGAKIDPLTWVPKSTTLLADKEAVSGGELEAEMEEAVERGYGSDSERVKAQ
jgi:hypothetical protein